MPYGMCFKRYTSLALQEKNTAAREMTYLGAVTVMRCIAMLRHAAMLVSCRAALTEQTIRCILSKSVTSALVWNMASVCSMRPTI